jgi:hypothetical protein
MGKKFAHPTHFDGAQPPPYKSSLKNGVKSWPDINGAFQRTEL